jgi:hypothetical protein
MMKTPSQCLSELKTRRDVMCWWFMWLVLALTWVILAGRAIRFTEIAAQYPIWDPVLITQDNLTYPHFCFRPIESNGVISAPSCNLVSGDSSTLLLTGLPTTTGCGPGKGTNCVCFNNYAFLDVGTDKAKVASASTDSHIFCTMSINIGSALLWMCDPNSDGTCGDPYGNPISTNVAPIASGFHTFVGLLPAYYHNANLTYNSTDYQIEKSVHVSDTPGATEVVIAFTSFRVFHYFPVDEFSGFRWLMVSATLCFFFMCIHRLAWLVFKFLLFRSSTLETGWGPVETAGSDASITKATAATPAPAPPSQPEGHKGYNSF